MSGGGAYVWEFHPKCSKFGTIVPLGPKTEKQIARIFFSLKGHFFRQSKNVKMQSCDFSKVHS